MTIRHSLEPRAIGASSLVGRPKMGWEKENTFLVDFSGLCGRSML